MPRRFAQRRLLTGLCVLLGLYACHFASIETPATPAPQSPSVTGTLAADPVVWGVADLHAHPAAHLAFGGLDGQSGLLWGDPGLPGGVMMAVPGGDLPDIPACDPEAHSANVADEVSRVTRAEVFGLLAPQANFPHVAHGGPAHDDEPPYESWPNGRDILHQFMNVQSLRRAYEGGLRLMVAATVDSQALILAMHTTIFPPPFVPSRDVERQSAEAQLVFIRNLVKANSDWMEIAATPEQAEAAIRANRLAIILALEMDGLRLEDVQYFVQTYGVGSIVPIHLIDNDVGGTAAYNDIFNAATALLAPMFGFPSRYISVEDDDTLGFHLGWPKELAIDGPSFNIKAVDYSTVASLGYSPYSQCAPPGSGVPDEDGTRNSVGLRNPQTLVELMKLGLILDIAHMGYRSTGETIDLAKATCGYPLVDTHTSIHFKKQSANDSERDLFSEHASYVASQQGVLGFGSGGRTDPTSCDPSAVGASRVASARGGPLASFNKRQQVVTIQMPSGGLACSKPLSPGAAIPSFGLQIQADQPAPPGTLVVAQIGFDGGHQESIPISLNELTPVLLDAGYTASAISSISVGLLNPSQCNYSDGGAIDLRKVDVVDPSGVVLESIEPNQLGIPAGRPLATLRSNRPTFLAYSRCPLAPPALCDAAESFLQPPAETTQHLRIRMRSGTQPLKSSSPLITGARVTGTLCPNPSCTNVSDPCSAPDFTMTPAGGWPSSTELDQFVAIERSAGASSTPPQAVAICVTQRDLAVEPWELDEVDVEQAQDPIRLWTGDYASYEASVFGGRPGAIGLGTDANGLAPQFPFADFAPAYETDGAGCGETTGDADAQSAQYGDSTTGGVFTLERPLRIGTTPLCLPKRGLATYGMLPEFFASVYHYSPDVYRSLFRSAAATIAAWRASRSAALAFATTPTTCAGANAGANGGGLALDAGADASAEGGAEGGP